MEKLRKEGKKLDLWCMVFVWCLAVINYVFCLDMKQILALLSFPNIWCLIFSFFRRLEPNNPYIFISGNFDRTQVENSLIYANMEETLWKHTTLLRLSKLPRNSHHHVPLVRSVAVTFIWLESRSFSFVIMKLLIRCPTNQLYFLTLYETMTFIFKQKYSAHSLIMCWEHIWLPNWDLYSESEDLFF